jgi:hypothetical protein
MCRTCASKRVHELLEKEVLAGLSTSGGKISVCVVAHHDHSHLRFRSSEGTSEWYYISWSLDILLSALSPELYNVHVHGDRDADGLDDSAAMALQEASGAFQNFRVGDSTCAICYDDVEEGAKDGLTLPCGHAFHQACVGRWLKTHRDCPNCRFELTSTTIADARKRAEEFVGRRAETRNPGWARHLRR